MSDLLKCPWCGLETEVDDDFENLDSNNVLTVYCQHCDEESYSYVEFIPYFNPLRKDEQK
jgi:hypothetical protein